MLELQGLAKRLAFPCGEGMILLVGFDSAWTPGNSGAIAGLLVPSGGDFREIGPPQVVNYSEAEQLILDWQRQFRPKRTLVLLDQPTIVVNPTGQRPRRGNRVTIGQRPPWRDAADQPVTD